MVRCGFRWLVVLALLGGCTTTATIRRSKSNGGTVEARILSADNKNVYLESYPNRIAIRRDEIADIDHPGNAAAVIGTVLTVYGVFNIDVAAPQCQRRGAAFCTGVFLPAAIGVPLTIWGLAVYLRSVTALNADTPTSPRYGQLFLLPTPQLTADAHSPGLTLGGRF